MSRTKVICILTHSPSPNSNKNIEKANIPKNYVEVDYEPKWLGSALAFIYNFFNQPMSNDFEFSYYKDLYSWSKTSKRLDYILSELATE